MSWIHYLFSSIYSGFLTHWEDKVFSEKSKSSINVVKIKTKKISTPIHNCSCSACEFEVGEYSAVYHLSSICYSWWV